MNFNALALALDVRKKRTQSGTLKLMFGWLLE